MSKVTNQTILEAVTAQTAQIASLTKSINDLVKILTKPANEGKGSKPSPAPARENKVAHAPKADAQARFEQMKAEFNKSRKAYKPSEKLVNAIKKDRVKITWAVAHEKYGFVGTKKDLQALKDKLCK